MKFNTSIKFRHIIPLLSLSMLGLISACSSTPTKQLIAVDVSVAKTIYDDNALLNAAFLKASIFKDNSNSCKFYWVDPGYQFTLEKQMRGSVIYGDLICTPHADIGNNVFTSYTASVDVGGDFVTMMGTLTVMNAAIDSKDDSDAFTVITDPEYVKSIDNDQTRIDIMNAGHVISGRLLVDTSIDDNAMCRFTAEQYIEDIGYGSIRCTEGKGDALRSVPAYIVIQASSDLRYGVYYNHNVESFEDIKSELDNNHDEFLAESLRIYSSSESNDDFRNNGGS